MSRSFDRREFLAGAAAAGIGVLVGGCMESKRMNERQPVNIGQTPNFIIHNGRIATQDAARSIATAAAIIEGHFVAVGDDKQILAMKGAGTKVIDLGGRSVIPGLNDSHLHIIRGGLNYNMELRWDGVPSLADAMRMLREQAARTPAPQWVRVVGGFCEFQFAERRLPTLKEINEASPDTPVFILHLYDRALLNRAALRAIGYDKNTPEPPGGVIERDKNGEPTGLLVANPNALILYKTLALGPKLSYDYQLNSTRHFMRELNRLGVTSCCDAGGGFQNYPEDYQVIQDLQKRGEMTVRIAYNLFTQNPKKERDDFVKWVRSAKVGQGDDFLRLNGAGEMLVYSAADFEDFRVARPDMPTSMEGELREIVSLLAKNNWPFRLHATYDETISRSLDVFEEVHRELPIDQLRWFFDHCETVSERNLDRIAALGGGIAIQHRMAFQGEYFIERYGKKAAQQTPPIRRMLDKGIHVGAGTDATRVASFNPWTSLSWLTTGRTVGGTQLYPESNLLDRMEALRRYTVGSAWFSREEHKKGQIAAGYLADFAVLSDDFFTVAPDRIRSIESLLTVVDGKPVYGAGPFADLDSPVPAAVPDWSPVKLNRENRHACAATSPILAQSACGDRLFGNLRDLLWPTGRSESAFGGCGCFAF